MNKYVAILTQEEMVLFFSIFYSINICTSVLVEIEPEKDRKKFTVYLEPFVATDYFLRQALIFGELKQWSERFDKQKQ
ncbi:MAG: hypothetical protein WC678_00615 [Parcubacteria group bacterium]|jgi:hypothetical protein